MQKSLRYIGLSTLTIVSFYVIFAGLLAITTVLGWSDWEGVGDWLLKAAAVAGIFLVINALIAFIISAFKSEK